jgi:thioredoxin 1
MIININKQNFNQEIVSSDKPVVIDVYATWCGPCQLVAPLFQEVAQELSDHYTFAKLNVDEVREIAIHYGVTSVPTFIFIKDNQVVGKEVGILSKDDLKAKITHLLG